VGIWFNTKKVGQPVFVWLAELNLLFRELKDKVAEADAACGLGAVYQQMGEYSTALRYHQADLDTAEELGLAVLQGRACGNLGTVHESLGNFEEAVRYQEQHLSVAAQTNDKLAKTMAYSSLGTSSEIWGAGSRNGVLCPADDKLKCPHIFQVLYLPTYLNGRLGFFPLISEL
jgi:tetratricopeptide (TPR) repeat protein